MEEWYYIGWEVKNRTKAVVKRFKCTHIKAHSTPVKGQCWQRTKYKIKTILSLRASGSQKSRTPTGSGDRQTFHRHIISMKTSLDPSNRAQWLTAQTSTKGVSQRRWTKSPADIYETLTHPLSTTSLHVNCVSVISGWLSISVSLTLTKLPKKSVNNILRVRHEIVFTKQSDAQTSKAITRCARSAA